MREVILLVGPPGCGKTTYVQEELPEYVHLSTDLGRINLKFQEALRSGKNIVIDATNRTKKVRSYYIDKAKASGYDIRAVIFKVPAEVCIERIKKRTEHPNLDKNAGRRIYLAVRDFFKLYEPVTPEEVPHTFID